MTEAGLKHDNGKLDWHSMPLEILEPLVEVFAAGCSKYRRFNCLLPFEDGNRRFYSAAMRHTAECQIDPLAIDPETGCYHEAQAAWNHLLRLYHAIKEASNAQV